MSPTTLLESMADAVVDAFSGGEHRALSQKALQRRFAEIQHRADARSRRLARTRSYQKRWVQHSHDEVVDLIRKRSNDRPVRSRA